MTVIFGFGLDDPIKPNFGDTHLGQEVLGPKGLIYLLANRFGLYTPPQNLIHLRLEHYRQAIKKSIENNDSAPFYAQSFQAAPFATAEELLARRDDLVGAGWDFEMTPKTPIRLASFALLESLYQDIQVARNLYIPGLADLQMAIEKQLPARHNPILELTLLEDQSLLPLTIQRLFNKLAKHGTTIKCSAPLIPVNPLSDLGVFQQSLKHPDQINFPVSLKNDGSLCLIRGENESILAKFMAKLLASSSSQELSLVVPPGRQSLDLAIVQEGLPSLGIQSSSKARPSLQALKLIPLFLWDPINPTLLMEFVSLQIKPLHPILAVRIAEHLAQYPGMKGESWYNMINSCFDRLKTQGGSKENLLKEARFQYQFLFERQRFPQHTKVPKQEVIELFDYLNSWAIQYFKDQGEKDESLFALSVQAQKIVMLIEAQPETSLFPIEIEDIVRTVLEAATLQVIPRQQNAFAITQQAHNWIQRPRKLIWWNFLEPASLPAFPKWRATELQFLKKRGVLLDQPTFQADFQSFALKKGLLLPQEQLILVIPEKVEGQSMAANRLLGNLETTFSNLTPITVTPFKPATILEKMGWSPPSLEALPYHPASEPQPFVQVNSKWTPLHWPDKLSPTKIEQMIYYPHHWFFYHYLKLKPMAIYTIAPPERLMGNLAHRFLEKILQQPIDQFDQSTLEQYIEELEKKLLPTEGATLLLYGKEADRIQFLRTMNYAAWTLINLIIENGWQVLETEHRIETRWNDTALEGRTDLILIRGTEKAIIDLKWSGLSYRKAMLKNEEDLQLNLYSQLLESAEWPYSGFYIINRAKMVCRNKDAFSQAETISSDHSLVEINERIKLKIQATYNWRKQQLQKGKVEIRSLKTKAMLESHYGEELLPLLEMKRESHRFEPYLVLANLT